MVLTAIVAPHTAYSAIVQTQKGEGEGERERDEELACSVCLCVFDDARPSKSGCRVLHAFYTLENEFDNDGP